MVSIHAGETNGKLQLVRRHHFANIIHSSQFLGTLGWTTGLATGLVAAQAITDYLEHSGRDDPAKKKQGHRFGNGIEIDTKLLAPTRFVE